MRIIVKNKWVSLRGSSTVKDESGKDLMKVQGKFFTFTRKKYVKNLNDETFYVLRNKFLKLFAYQAFVLDPTEKKILARIRRKIFSLHDHYDVHTEFGEIVMRGNILGFDYHITLDGREIGHVSRNISLRDSFILDLEDGQDPYFFVALLIALDNITDEKRQNDSSSY